MEILDDLDLKGLKILQNSSYFKFGIDSVLLSDFAKIKKAKTVVDFGTGNGIIPLLLYGKYEGIKIYGLELLKELYHLAERNVELNNLKDSIEIINGNIKDAVKIFGRSNIDYVVTNPPYLKGDGILNENEYKRVARHEIECTLKDLLHSAYGILKENGTFYMVHRVNRLADVLFEMRKSRIEPKILRFVAKNEESAPNIFLIKGIKNSKSDIIVQKTLNVYDKDNKYTFEIEKIYGRA
jgi:tRNA1Val (adenine37-N6)-methyltransferase